eukprot:7827463-Alexandrium_andersonii.AAC.1
MAEHAITEAKLAHPPSFAQVSDEVDRRPHDNAGIPKTPAHEEEAIVVVPVLRAGAEQDGESPLASVSALMPSNE